MPAEQLHPTRAAFAPLRAPALIAAGLAILLAAGTWPVLPVVTGMALVVLGATQATIDRFRGTPALLPVLLAHALIYGGLYAIFVGAALHTASQSARGIGWGPAIDLALSIVPMALAVGASLDSLRKLAALR